LTFKEHLKENFSLAYPVMLTNLGHVIMGVTDNIAVGHLGAVPLAAAGLALVIFNVLLLFGIGVSYAITPFVASAHGAQNHQEVIATVRHGLVINVLNSLFLIGVIYFGKNLLYHIEQPPEVVSQALPFLSIITFSLIPVMIFQTFKQFAEGLSFTRVAMMVMLGANVINIFLNYSLVYGHFGFAPMGLEGSGWATFCSRMFMAVAIVIYVHQAPAFRKYRAIFSMKDFSRSVFNKMLHIGIPSGGQFIFEVAAFDFSLVMIGWLGTTSQAAHQVSINMATVSYMTTAGIAAAATVRVGYFSGANDVVNLRRAAYSTIVMALGVMSLWAILFITARHWLPTLYIQDEAVISTASILLIVAGLFQLSDGLQVVCASALRGLQDVKVPSLFIFISYWVIGLPLGYYLAFMLHAGAIGIWWGLFIGLTLTALAMFFRLRLLIKRF
jgi:multidrug resistance protein, MATE family